MLIEGAFPVGEVVPDLCADPHGEGGEERGEFVIGAGTDGDPDAGGDGDEFLVEDFDAVADARADDEFAEDGGAEEVFFVEEGGDPAEADEGEAEDGFEDGEGGVSVVQMDVGRTVGGEPCAEGGGTSAHEVGETRGDEGPEKSKKNFFLHGSARSSNGHAETQRRRGF